MVTQQRKSAAPISAGLAKMVISAQVIKLERAKSKSPLFPKTRIVSKKIGSVRRLRDHSIHVREVGSSRSQKEDKRYFQFLFTKKENRANRFAVVQAARLAFRAANVGLQPADGNGGRVFNDNNGGLNGSAYDQFVGNAGVGEAGSPTMQGAFDIAAQTMVKTLKENGDEDQLWTFLKARDSMQLLWGFAGITRINDRQVKIRILVPPQGATWRFCEIRRRMINREKSATLATQWMFADAHKSVRR